MKMFTAMIILIVLVTPLEAQWLDRRTAGIPRTADGKPNLKAAAPRTADGKPDLAGLWEWVNPDTAIGNVSLRKPGDLQPADIQPWAQALLEQRAENFGVDNPHYKCLPDGPNYSAGLGMKKFLQTPAMIVILQEDLTYREIYMDGIFGRPLGRRHTGRGEQRVQRPDMAARRLSSYRSVAND